MNTMKTEFSVVALRLTVTDRFGQHGKPLVRGGAQGFRARRFKILMSPVVKRGKTVRREGPPLQIHKFPDTFEYFELDLKDRRLVWRRDKQLTEMLELPCAFEFWTRDEEAWIHWAFPYTSWEKIGRGRYEGMTFEGSIKPDDVPDMTEITQVGWWKTFVPPPS